MYLSPLPPGLRHLRRVCQQPRLDRPATNQPQNRQSPQTHLVSMFSFLQGSAKVHEQQRDKRTGDNDIKLFTVVIYDFCNKVERLSLASFSSLF
jgi:hypothetical protein